MRLGPSPGHRHAAAEGEELRVEPVQHATALVRAAQRAAELAELAISSELVASGPASAMNASTAASGNDDSIAESDANGHRPRVHVQPFSDFAGTRAKVSMKGRRARSPRDQLLAALVGAEHGPVDDDQLLAAEEVRQVRHVGSRIARNEVVISSGLPAPTVPAQHRPDVGELPHEHAGVRRLMSNILNTWRGTTPKLPPPPRTAQNSSGLVSASARIGFAVGDDDLDGGEGWWRRPSCGVPADATAEG